ncbi:MAG: hypothetical protein WDN03_09680 [Rhizomicrobium sp.]
MHHKVPVGGSVAHAYAFLLQNLIQILGTGWLAALLYGVGYYLIFQNLQAWMPLERHDLASVVLTTCSVLGAAGLTLMIRAVLGISLTQEALGVRKDFTLAHFVIGPRELRLFFGYVRYYLVFLLLYVAVLAVGVGAMFAARHYGAALAPKFAPGGVPLAVIAAALLTIVLALWFVLAMLRLYFLLMPVASAEHHTRLARAWALTRGNTFRILGIYLGTFLPLGLAAAVGLYFVIGPEQWAAALQAAANHKPGAPPALWPFYEAHAFVLSAAIGVLTLVGTALFAGASANAYRILTGHELPELEDDAALVAPLLEPEAVAPAHPVATPSAPAIAVPAPVEAPAPVHEMPPEHHEAHHGGHEEHHPHEPRKHDVEDRAEEEPVHPGDHGHHHAREDERDEPVDDRHTDNGRAHHGNGHENHDHGHDAKGHHDHHERRDPEDDDRAAA